MTRTNLAPFFTAARVAQEFAAFRRRVEAEERAARLAVVVPLARRRLR